MADQQVETVDFDDNELFDAAMAEPSKPEPEAPAAEKPAETTGQPRDEQGRFAPKQQAEAPAQQPTAAAEPQPPKQDEADGPVPSWRARELRHAREEAERRADEASRQSYALQAQLQAMQRELQQLKTPKQEPVDFYANPEQALQQRLTPLEERFARLEADMRLGVSRSAVIAMHGAQEVMAMEKAIDKAMSENHPDMPGLAAQMRQSPDPAAVAMQWYRRTKLWEATGGDPDAYRARVLDEALKDKEFLAKAIEAARGQAGTAPAAGRPAIDIPPSLSRVPGSGGNPVSAADNDVSDQALFRHAMSSSRR